MVKEWPQKRDHREPIVKVSDPAMEWHEVDLNDLLVAVGASWPFASASTRSGSTRGR